MLHKINLPDCTAHLNWVVRLQCNLLHALCDPDLAPADVTADWAIALRPDVDGDWIRRLCRWSKTKKSMLARMKAVAGLAVDEKQAVITHYEANMQFPDSFDDAKEAPPATTPLPNGLSADAEAAYRDYFLMFYDPIFYGQKGYPIDDPNLNGKWFTKDSYLESYHAANPAIKVCPLCDGTMDGAEVDHWLAKNRHFPELNCHPQNLVEICGACNGRTNKGEKLALDTGTMDPFKNWFHPYMRPAAGGVTVEVVDRRPKLSGNDDDTERRIENLDGLINLSERWAQKFDNLTSRIEERIRHHRRRKRIFDKDSLLDQIQSWLIDAQSEIGLGEYKLLESTLLTEASDSTSDMFVELLVYATEAP